MTTEEFRSTASSRRTAALRTAACAAVVAVAALWAPIAAAQAVVGDSSRVEGVTASGPEVVPIRSSRDLRSLPPASFKSPSESRRYRPVREPPAVTVTPPSSPPAPDSYSNPVAAVSAPMPAASQNFAGMSYADLCGGSQCGAGWPPDVNGDVGPNHYIQAVNDAYAIYSKTGTLLASFTEDQLWSGIGTSPCNGNSQGDPVVLYDALADRWILTHFAFAYSGPDAVPPFYQCIAVSQTSDPVAGGWYFYALQMDTGGSAGPPGSLNDYPKFGVWTDCVYMAANQFSQPTDTFVGSLYASFNRADLYSGAPLRWGVGFIATTGDPFTMIPSNLSGKAAFALPPGTPNYLVSQARGSFSFQVRKFAAGTDCAAGGTLSAPVNVSQAAYFLLGAKANVPQPNTPTKLDSLATRLMQKVQYRKVGSSESLWVVHTVQGTSVSNIAPQWAQIDVTGGVVATTPVQQQIYAPDATLHRWMGSLAVDGQGNMALGYSTSNGTAPNFPSIAYSGRLASDPLERAAADGDAARCGPGSQGNTCGGLLAVHPLGRLHVDERRPGGRLHVLVHQRVLRQPGERHERQLADAHRRVQVRVVHDADDDHPRELDQSGHARRHRDVHRDGHRPRAHGQRAVRRRWRRDRRLQRGGADRRAATAGPQVAARALWLRARTRSRPATAATARTAHRRAARSRR